MTQPKYISLFELNQQIQQSMVEKFPESIWIIAEIGELKISAAGHCYMELIQKDSKAVSIKAKASATIWAATFRMLQPYFEMTTGRTLEEGIKVLIRVTVEFHEIYGLSLKVMDIDPTYTVGELELQRQQTIQQLVEDGVFEMNKQLPFPEIPQRLAVISSDKSAGYQDFIHQLQSNTKGFYIKTKLFSAIMQGKEAEPSILTALGRIFEERNNFDAVVLIRGGGAQTDLSCFDSYLLAYHLVQMPLPVLTGIGHTKDISVADMVSHTSVKTPTAAAEIILTAMNAVDQKFSQYGNWISSYSETFLDAINNDLRHYVLSFSQIHNTISSKAQLMERRALEIKNSVYQRVNKEKLMTNLMVQSLKKIPKTIIEKQTQQLSIRKDSAFRQVTLTITQEHKQLNSRNTFITSINPENLLKMGFSISRINGKSVKSISSILPEDILETTLLDGKIISVVQDRRTR
jgi:exodeoxyribonuclease VII, large subunit